MDRRTSKAVPETKTGSALVIIDNGHGCETPGKRSPDGKLLEWEWTRRAARMLAAALENRSVEAVILTPEENDISLRERCRRANAFAAGSDALLISIHNNAAGDGSRWMNARGFSAFVAHGASRKATVFASRIVALARSRGLTGNRCIPPEGFWRGNFAMVRDTSVPAVLTENLFMDNREDLAFLRSPEGMEAIVRLHADAILNYFNIE